MEELEGVRLSLAGAAVPDPEKEWDGSRAYATIDKRIVSLPEVEGVLDEAENALQQYVKSLFSTFRPLLRTYWAGQDAEAADHLIRLGEQQEQIGRHRKARQCFETALAVSLPLTDKRTQIVTLRRIARASQALGDLNEALRYYQRSAELARDAGALSHEVIAETGIGNVLAIQGRWSDSEAYYRIALDHAEVVQGDDSLDLQCAQLYNNLGMITTRQDSLADAERWFARALESWATIDSPVDLAVCYHNQGLLRKKEGRQKEARALFMEALALPISSSLRTALAIDLAESYLKDGMLLEAEEWGREAEQHAIAARSPYFLGRMYHGLGNIARARADANGITFFEKALEIARHNELPLLEGETLTDYALLRSQIGGTEEAVSYLERAREIFDGLGAVHELARAGEVLGEIVETDEPLIVAD